LLNTTKGISQFRGEWLDWRGYSLMATYHPAYLLRNPPAKSEVWKDLQKVMAKLGLEVPRKNKSS
jgi:uracil-DNA glycosylase family 4